MAASLLDLDDGCLLQVFRLLVPLPDLFLVAQTCRRLRTLTCDKRMWLVVSDGSVRCHPPERAEVVLPTLAAAVEASRPGDTIWLSPGSVHLACDVLVRWPLQIMGGGTHPEDTVLQTPHRAACALEFRSTGKVINLSILTKRSACITHRRGQLKIEHCILESNGEGLQHLTAPLITFATMWRCRGEDAKAQVAATSPSFPDALEGFACGHSAALDKGGGGEAGAGSLSVADTRIQGSATSAVHCRGSGALQNVRVVYHSHAAVFWFRVDSSAEEEEARERKARQSAVVRPKDAVQRKRKHDDQSTSDGPFIDHIEKSAANVGLHPDEARIRVELSAIDIGKLRQAVAAARNGSAHSSTTYGSLAQSSKEMSQEASGRGHSVMITSKRHRADPHAWLSSSVKEDEDPT